MASIYFDADATKKALRRVSKRLGPELQRSAVSHGKFAVGYLRRERFRPYPGYDNEVRGRNFLYSRTRGLMKSIRSFGLQGNRGVTVEAGRGLPDDRATANEFGKVITAPPKIPIPLRDNITGTGRRRFPSVAAALAAGGQYWTSPSTGKTLIRRLKRGGTKARPFEYLFVLVDRVRIPARFKFRRTLEADPKLVRDRRSRFVNAQRRAIAAGFGRAGL